MLNICREDDDSLYSLLFTIKENADKMWRESLDTINLQTYRVVTAVTSSHVGLTVFLALLYVLSSGIFINKILIFVLVTRLFDKNSTSRPT